jgi:hypothetical protein
MVAGWLQRHQQQVITYFIEENHVLKAQLSGRRLRLTATARRRLVTLAHPLGRKRLIEVAAIATPDTFLRWYKRLIAQKPVIEPNRVANDLNWEAVIFIPVDGWCVHAPSMAHSVSARQAAQQVDKAYLLSKNHQEAISYHPLFMWRSATFARYRENTPGRNK